MVSNELKALVEAKIEECRKIIKKHYGQDITPSKISYTARGTVGGTANPSTYEIRLNPMFLNHYKDAFIADTVVHEYAHIVTLKCHPEASAHGKDWKRVMKLLGGKVSRCHSYDNSVVYNQQKQRNYMCTCCGEMLKIAKADHEAIMAKKYKQVHDECNAPIIFVGP